ncbi:hypothetical protein SLEP1_g24872 [Rubroshorea leprosula]|uniref:Uncharacterized protein n=1 Tax=Rubroshorea leprosula TaxID=152421 RepID=A0AAV5JH15_9ROSI|nr:hypothetical protein SLEP1_g24872 [Rubroshorea leprosula]
MLLTFLCLILENAQDFDLLNDMLVHGFFAARLVLFAKSMGCTRTVTLE